MRFGSTTLSNNLILVRELGDFYDVLRECYGTVQAGVPIDQLPKYFQSYYVASALNKMEGNLRKVMMKVLGLDEPSIEYYKDHSINDDELCGLMLCSGKYCMIEKGVIEETKS